MNLVAAIAGLAFLVVVTLIVGFWWFAETGRMIRQRLGTRFWIHPKADPGIARADPREVDSTWARLRSPLIALAEQAGLDMRDRSRILVLMGTCAVVGGGAGWLRTGQPVWGVVAALVAGSLPILHLAYKRHQRLQRFERQFPDALDMMTRSIRAGHALGAAIQVVGEEMPDPAAEEFRRVSEETRLGMDPGEALFRLQRRIPTGDTAFFCTAITIQRSAGGNLAEILDSLSEVIRERFKVLSHARVLSVQHRWSAICVGVFPIVLAIMFELVSPGYFEPLLNSPLASRLIWAGIILEGIGLFMIWRIAQIRV